MKDARYLTTSVCPGSRELSDLLEQSSEGLRRYHLIMTAWDLGLFDRTAAPVGHEDLAAQLGCHPQMTKLFCDALAEVGLLEKAGPNYVNSPLARSCLDKASPHCMESTMRNLKLNNDRWAHLALVLRNGPVVQDRKDRFSDDWLISIAEWAGTGSVREAVQVIFAHADMKRWRRLLDLGGGHGLYSVAFTALNPELEAFVFDLPSVIPLTRRYIEQFEAERVRTMPGDFYKDDIGEGYDVIFSSFNQSANDPALLPKIHNALRPGGDLIIRRFEDDGQNDAMNTLDWNLITFEGKKIGSKRHTSDTVPGKEEYLLRLEENGFAVRSVVPAGEMSVMIFAQRPMTGGAESDG
jgi:precorrin-6B methylase 2